MTNRSTLPRVIKREHQAPAPPGVERPHEEELRGIISGSRVHLPDPTDALLPAKSRRVLRGHEARTAALPFPLKTHEEPPASVLPTPSEDTKPAPERIEEPELAPTLVARLQEAWSEAWQQELIDAVDRARIEAGNEVREELQERIDALQEELEARRAAYREDARRLRDTWKSFMAQNEPLLLDLAFGIAEALFDAPLPDDVRGIAARTLTAAVDQLAADPPLTISLHPVDLLRLRESGIVEQLEAVHGSLRWDARSDFRQGDWVAQSPQGVVRRVKEELMAALREQLETL